jgi:hypothetical protein
MSRFNLTGLKKSQVAILPGMLAAYAMGQRDELFGISSTLIFALMMLVVVVNMYLEYIATRGAKSD